MHLRTCVSVCYLSKLPFAGDNLVVVWRDVVALVEPARVVEYVLVPLVTVLHVHQVIYDTAP